jgi:hypothetical protein
MRSGINQKFQELDEHLNRIDEPNSRIDDLYKKFDRALEFLEYITWRHI